MLNSVSTHCLRSLCFLIFVVAVVACLLDLLVFKFVLFMTCALLKLELLNRVVLRIHFYLFLFKFTI